MRANPTTYTEVMRLNEALADMRVERDEAQQRLADVVEEVQKREDSQDRIRRQLTAEVERLHSILHESHPKRFDHCDETCTTDCGHCKGDHDAPRKAKA